MAKLRKFAAGQAVVIVGVIFAFLAAALADSFRVPERQVTASLYATGVQAYRLTLRKITSKWVRCPFRPTCSEYSQQAVKRYGIRRGLWLTVDRLHRCRKNVPTGTFDPVPAMSVHSQ